LEKENPSLFKRLNYAKEILVNMINPKKDRNKETENEPEGIPAHLGTMKQNLESLSASKRRHSAQRMAFKSNPRTSRASTSSNLGRYTHTVY